MALTVPTRGALLRLMHEESFEDEAWADLALQQATDLMSIATSLTDDPIDAVAARLVSTGILAMAHYLLVSSDDMSSRYSPFSSERLGSYSYTKSNTQMLDLAGAGAPTGVAWFDTAVRYILNNILVDGSDLDYFTEDVFYPENFANVEPGYYSLPDLGFNLAPQDQYGL